MKTARPEDKALNANEQKTPPENGKGAANPGAVASAPAAAPATDRLAIPTPAGQTASFRYVDRPELVETFVDSITGMFFDGQSLRIEFAVSRVDEIKPNTPITGRRAIRHAAWSCLRSPPWSSSTACSRSGLRWRKPDC